jgi:hypothetical protein
MRRFNLALYPIALMLRIRMLLQPSRLWHGSATTCPAHHTGIHTACLPSRHPSVNVLCHPIKTAHPPVSCFTPQVASAFRGPPLRSAASPHHEPRFGTRFDPSRDLAGAHGGRRHFHMAHPAHTPTAPSRDRLISRRARRIAPTLTPQETDPASDISPPHPAYLPLKPPSPLQPFRSAPGRDGVAFQSLFFPPTWERRYASGMLLLARPSPPEKKGQPPPFLSSG